MAQVSWQEYKSLQIRASAVLTNAYVAGTVLGVPTNDANQVKTYDLIEQINYLALECAFTLGSLTNVAIKVEFSEDNTNWYQLQTGTFSSGSDTMTPAFITLSATGNYYIDINKEFSMVEDLRRDISEFPHRVRERLQVSTLAITAVYGVC